MGLKAVASGIASITGGTISNATLGPTSLLAQSAVAVATPADTSEDILATLSVAAGLIGANGRIRLRVTFTCTSSANNKTFTVHFSGVGGTSVVTVAQTTITRCSIICEIANRNATNSQITTAIFASSSATTELAPTASAIDTTAATTIVITGTKALGSETLQLESYCAEVIH